MRDYILGLKKWPKKKRLIKKLLTKKTKNDVWNRKWIGDKWRVKKTDKRKGLIITNDLLVKVFERLKNETTQRHDG